jgi:hypothetical protein
MQQQKYIYKYIKILIAELYINDIQFGNKTIRQLLLDGFVRVIVL